ncbi:MAG: aryl sulfotransferase [Campylobacterales bacterium]|nr:aryl sulfotransferase [Campylobacterales bacterium]
MKKEMLSILTALFTAVLATTCCLPPLLFLLFGISFGFLSFAESLSPFRIPLSLFSLLILWFSWRSYTAQCFTCNLQKRKLYAWMYAMVLGVILVILIYPEFAQFFLEGNE